MNRTLMWLAVSVLLTRLPAMAQETTVSPDSSSASAIAAREAADERNKRMAADLQAVQADNESLRGKISTLEQDIQSLHQAMSKPADNSAVMEQLKALAQKIEEVDKKRLEDKDAISEEIRKSIEKVEKLVGGGPVIPPPLHEPKSRSKPDTSGTSSSATSDLPATVNGYSYTIKDGDTLGAIIKAYNDDYKSKGLKTITLRQAKEANPTINWNRLKVGQKIVIPRPDGG